MRHGITTDRVETAASRRGTGPAGLQARTCGRLTASSRGGAAARVKSRDAPAAFSTRSSRAERAAHRPRALPEIRSLSPDMRDAPPAASRSFLVNKGSAYMAGRSMASCCQWRASGKGGTWDLHKGLGARSHGLTARSCQRRGRKHYGTGSSGGGATTLHAVRAGIQRLQASLAQGSRDGASTPRRLKSSASGRRARISRPERWNPARSSPSPARQLSRCPPAHCCRWIIASTPCGPRSRI